MACVEAKVAWLQEHVEKMFNGGDVAYGIEDVLFVEIVGMQGIVFHLIENGITVSPFPL